MRRSRLKRGGSRLTWIQPFVQSVSGSDSTDKAELVEIKRKQKNMKELDLQAMEKQRGREK